MATERDIYWMQQALVLAHQAAENHEVPVGALIVLDDQVISRSYNKPITNNDPTAHAEILALREAANHLGNYRLLKTTLYVTLEPCLMCLGAMVHARVERLVFGAFDPKSGAAVSCASMFELPFLNHRVKCEGGVLNEACADVLKHFFKKRR